MNNSTIQEMLNHFAQHDPVMHQVLVKMSPQPLKPRLDQPLFQEIAETIIGQQLSNKAADTIIKRFRQAVDNQVTPDSILAKEDQLLRDVGLSWAKVKYVKDLASKIESEELHLESLLDQPNETIIVELTKVKGIGRWTVEMFLLFTLGRADIFSAGDLGLRKGLMKLYGLPEKYPTSEAEKIVAQWSPWRSYGSLGLWYAVDN